MVSVTSEGGALNLVQNAQFVENMKKISSAYSVNVILDVRHTHG